MNLTFHIVGRTVIACTKMQSFRIKDKTTRNDIRYLKRIVIEDKPISVNELAKLSRIYELEWIACRCPLSVRCN